MTLKHITVVLLCLLQFAGAGCRKATSASSGRHTFAYSSATDKNDACSGPFCTLTIPSTAANSVLAVVVYVPSTQTIRSIQGCDTTWSIGKRASHAAYNASNGGTGLAISPSTPAGCTSITVTLNSTPASNWDVAADEFTVIGAGAAEIDQFAATNANVSGFVPSVTLSSFTGLTGTNDLLLQALNSDGKSSVLSPPYVFDTTQDFLYLLNSTSGAPPTLTNTNGASTLGVAIK